MRRRKQIDLARRIQGQRCAPSGSFMYFSPMSVVLFEISHWFPKECMLFWLCTFKSILLIGTFSRNLLLDPKPSRSINQHGRVYVPMDLNLRLSFKLNRYAPRIVLLLFVLFMGLCHNLWSADDFVPGKPDCSRRNSQESEVRSLLFRTTENIASNNDGDTTTQEATQRYNNEIVSSLKRNNNLEWC